MTDDAILAHPGFLATAERVLDAGGSDVALHVRGHATAAAALHSAAERLRAAATNAGSWLLVNDRIDIALAVGADGVQLGARSIPVAQAVRLLGGSGRIGYSAHEVTEARRARADGADFVVLGTIYRTATHEGRVPAGVSALRACVTAGAGPVLAIGGVTPERLREVAAAGAHGAAVLGGVWGAEDPVGAARAYVVAAGAAWIDRS